MGMAVNIVLTLLLINVMLFFAYPSNFGGNTGLIEGLSQMGYDISVTNSTLSDYDMVIAPTNSSNTTTIVEDKFGINQIIQKFTDSATGVVDWLGGAGKTILWIGSFMFAGATIVSSIPDVPSFLAILIILIYGVGYIFALLEIFTGR